MDRTLVLDFKLPLTSSVVTDSDVGELDPPNHTVCCSLYVCVELRPRHVNRLCTHLYLLMSSGSFIFADVFFLPSLGLIIFLSNLFSLYGR